MAPLTFYDSGIDKAISGFGKAAADQINKKKIRAKELSENPATLQGLSAAYRAALKAGQADAFFDGLGVDRADMEPKIAAYQPSNAERYDIALGENGGPEVKAEADLAKSKADILTSKVAGLTAGETIASGLIHQRISADVAGAIKENRVISAELIRNLPEIDAEGKLIQNKADQAENVFRGSVFRRRNEGGIDRLTVDAERLKLLTDQQGLKLKDETLTAFKNHLDSLDPNSREYKEAIIAIENPSELSHIQFHEGLDVEQSIAAAKLAGSASGDKLAATAKVSDQIQNGIKDLNKMVDDGADQDIIDTQRLLLNNWRNISQSLQEDGTIFPMGTVGAELEKGFTGKESGIKLFNEDVKSEKVRSALNSIVNGEVKLSDIGVVDPKTGKSFLDTITPLEREELFKNLGALQQKKSDVANGKITPAQAILPNAASLQSKLDTLVEIRAKLDSGKESKDGVFRAGTSQALGLSPSIANQKATLDRQITQLKSQLAILANSGN